MFLCIGEELLPVAPLDGPVEGAGGGCPLEEFSCYADPLLGKQSPEAGLGSGEVFGALCGDLGEPVEPLGKDFLRNFSTCAVT